ncbi:MAG: DUF1648 domain-containing protein [Capnocytophaga sp.]|nr:DUF1648 domain-containing protein [Capnocytophaga sp.]
MKAKGIWYSSVMLWFLTTAILLVIYPTLPEVVPTHLDFTGEVDSYAGKEAVFVLSGINLLLMLLFLFCRKNVQHLNYPFAINGENRERAYRGMLLFLSIFSLVVNVLYFAIAYAFYVVEAPESTVFIILIMTGLYLASTVFTVYFFKRKKS